MIAYIILFICVLGGLAVLSAIILDWLGLVDEANSMPDAIQFRKHRELALRSRKARELLRKIDESTDAKTIKNLTEELENL